MFLTPEEIKRRNKQRAMMFKASIPIIAVLIGALIAMLGSRM